MGTIAMFTLWNMRSPGYIRKKLKTKEVHEGRKGIVLFRIKFNKQISDSRALKICSINKKTKFFIPIFFYNFSNSALINHQHAIVNSHELTGVQPSLSFKHIRKFTFWKCVLVFQNKIQNWGKEEGHVKINIY
jgi:hypothetical protein